MTQNSAAQHLLAVDIGATKAAIAVISDDLKIINQTSVPTGSSENIWENLEKSVKDLISHSGVDIFAVGIGSAGPINISTGEISPVNIPTWRDFPIVENFSNLIGTSKVKLCGDAVALTLAESKIGAGQKVDNFLGMVVSTGVGGGLFLNGKIHNGISGNAGYFGHHSISFEGQECTCGRIGCVELYASGPMMVDSAIKDGWKSDNANFESLSEAARTGDPIAIQSIENGAKALAVGIVNVLEILDINTVIVGGGVIKAGAIYWNLLEKHVQAEARFAKFLQKVDLRQSKLSSDAGLFGAALLAMDNH
jgi:glucokinase